MPNFSRKEDMAFLFCKGKILQGAAERQHQDRKLEIKNQMVDRPLPKNWHLHPRKPSLYVQVPELP